MRIIISAILILISGCAMNSGPKFSPESIAPGESLIYIYREKQFTGSANSVIPRVYVNGDKVANLKMGGYIPVIVKPGEVKMNLINTAFGLEIDKPFSYISFNIDEGEVMYLKYSVSVVGFKSYGSTTVADAKSHFYPVLASKASEEIKSYSLLKRLQN